MSPGKQIQHTFKDCKSCKLTYTSIQAYFTLKSNRFIGIQKQTNREFTTDVVRVTLHDQACTNGTSLREAGTAEKALYDQINLRSTDKHKRSKHQSKKVMVKKKKAKEK